MKKPDDLVTREDLEFQTQQLKSYINLKITEKFADFYFYIFKVLAVIATIGLLIIFIKLL